jgi:Glycosyltransferase family 87
MSERALRITTWTSIALWVLLMFRLQIADVWDETVGLVFFGDPAKSLAFKFKFILTESLGFWRPLPTWLAAFVLHLIPDSDVNFRVLRTVNILTILGSLALLLKALETWNEPSPRMRLAFTIAMLFSGSAVITASWYANLWDALVLLLVSWALLLVARGRDLAAGIVLGVSFFCKETTALALPFILVLFAAKRITFKQALRIGIPATILGAIYFAIRAKIVPFGGAGDVHGFGREHLVPTILGFTSTFWQQHMKDAGPPLLGFAALLWFLAWLRKPRVIGAVLLFFVACILVYWGMFVTWQNGVTVMHLNFVGRLYLVPAAMMLFVLALERRTLAIAVLCIPIVIGAYLTYRDHLRFQRTYARVYRTARESAQKPLRVHYPEKPLHDPVRGIEIGDYPDAPVRIEPRTGKLLFK